MGSTSHITLRAASKGRIDEKTGMANPSCEETQERERSAVEDRDNQETNSSKDHGRRKSNDIEQVTNIKVSHPIMDKEGQKEEDEGRYYVRGARNRSQVSPWKKPYLTLTRKMLVQKVAFTPLLLIRKAPSPWISSRRGGRLSARSEFQRQVQWIQGSGMRVMTTHALGGE